MKSSSRSNNEPINAQSSTLVHYHTQPHCYGGPTKQTVQHHRFVCGEPRGARVDYCCSCTFHCCPINSSSSCCSNTPRKCVGHTTTCLLLLKFCKYQGSSNSSGAASCPATAAALQHLAATGLPVAALSTSPWHGSCCCNSVQRQQHFALLLTCSSSHPGTTYAPLTALLHSCSCCSRAPYCVQAMRHLRR